MAIPTAFVSALDSKAQEEVRKLLKDELDRRDKSLRDVTENLGIQKGKLSTHSEALGKGRLEHSAATATLNAHEVEHKDAKKSADDTRKDSDAKSVLAKDAMNLAIEKFNGIQPEIEAAQKIANAELDAKRQQVDEGMSAVMLAEANRQITENSVANEKRNVDKLNDEVRSAQDVVNAARKEVDRCVNVLQSASNALSDILKDVIKRARGDDEGARKDEENANAALTEAKKELTKKEGLLKLAQDAAAAGQQLLDKAGQELEKARKAVEESGKRLADATKTFDLQKHACALRNRTIQEFSKTPGEWIKFIESAGTVGEKSLLNIVREYHSAVDAAAAAGKELMKAKELVADTLHKVEESKIVQDIKQEAVKAREQVVAESQNVVKTVEKAAKDGVALVKDAIAFLADQEVIPYQIDSKMEFSINTYAGSMHGKLDLDFAGASMDSEQVKELIRGNFSLPAFNPIQLAAACFATKLSINDEGYLTSRSIVYQPQPFAAERPTTDAVSYFASKRFVDWAEGGTVVRLIASSIADGGETAKSEVKRQLLMEFEDISTWAKLQGQELSDEVAAELLLSIIEDRAPSLPTMSFEFRKVHYDFSMDAYGTCMLPKPLRERAESLFGTVTGRLNALANSRKARFLTDHGGFLIVIDNIPQQSFDDNLARFDQLFLKGDQSTRGNAAKVFRLIAAKIKDDKVRQIVKEIVSTLDQGGGSDVNILRSMDGLVSFRSKDLQKFYMPGRRIINLLPTEFGEKAESVVKRCAMGNKGAASMEVLEFDLGTYKLYGRARIRHSHSWGKLKDILGKI